jgi:hypothetical protein
MGSGLGVWGLGVLGFWGYWGFEVLDSGFTS